MYYYKVYGKVLETDIEFMQLVRCDEISAPDIIVREGMAEEWIAKMDECKKNNQFWEFGNTTSWLCNSTCYLLVENGKELRYVLIPGKNEMYLQSYILGFGLSMMAMQQGILSIHCSAIADEHGALLIAGESGAGKSTVTTEFLEKGYRLMGDDIAWVNKDANGNVVAAPGFPYQKLCRNVAFERGLQSEEMIYIDEDKDKFLVPFRGEFSTESVPIKGFIYLVVTDGEEVVSEPVKGISSFQVIANNLFLRHLLGNDKYKPEIGQKCLEIAAQVPIVIIGRPQEKDTTAKVVSEAFKYADEWRK